MFGLRPLNSKIGAKIRMIRAKASKQPPSIFSVKLLGSNSLLYALMSPQYFA